MATMVGAACFAVSGISETLGQEKEKSWPVYIATEEVAETTYMPEVEETTQPTEAAKAVETEEPLIASMDWGKDDSYLLCKIAMAEAESEGVKGKALVMLVVLNRVWSNEFPDTIEEVIFQKNQFSPVANGRYDAVEPDEECYEALKLIQVDHWNESQDALYFESKSDSKWHSENLEFLFKYGKEANQEYMSVSGYKDFAGTYGKMPCEFYGMEKLNGRWEDEKSTALLVGSYVDSYFEGSLEQFKKDNPEIFTQKGELKANFKQAKEIIARIERDEYFMKYMSGQKQVIMTGELFGAKWKIKMDSYIPGVAIVDLKVMASITDLKWVKDIGYLDFVRYWGYDIQGAVYQEIVRQNTGEKLPFFIAGATKQTEPDIRIIHVTDNYLQEALHMVEMNMPRILRVKNGEVEPDRCELCDCCRHNRVLKKPISIMDLTAGI